MTTITTRKRAALTVAAVAAATLLLAGCSTATPAVTTEPSIPTVSQTQEPQPLPVETAPAVDADAVATEALAGSTWEGVLTTGEDNTVVSKLTAVLNADGTVDLPQWNDFGSYDNAEDVWTVEDSVVSLTITQVSLADELPSFDALFATSVDAFGTPGQTTDTVVLDGVDVADPEGGTAVALQLTPAADAEEVTEG